MPANTVMEFTTRVTDQGVEIKFTRLEKGLDRVRTAAAKATSDAKKNFASLGTDIEEVSKRIRDQGQELQTFGSELSTSVSLPLAAAAAGVTFFGATFEQSMTRSTAIMGDLSQQMREDMVTAAKEVSEVTAFSASEAADAYFFLASAGLDAKQSIASLPQVAKFAQAGAFDLARATDLLTDAQSALGLTIRDDVTKNMENMARVSDVLVKANTLANATVEQFSESLTNKAGSALRLVNKDLEEGAAVLAVFADQGVKGAVAGEQLNIVLRELQSRAVKNKEEFERLGITVFDETTGKMLAMADIIESLEGTLEGLSDEQKRATLITAGFQDRSVSAMLQLVGFSDQIRKYEEGMRDASDITGEVAEKQLANFIDQIGLTGSKVQNLAIEIFTNTLAPALTDIVLPALEMGVGLLARLADFFGALPQPVQTVVLGMAALAAAVGPATFVLGKMMTLVGTIPLAFTKARVATATLGTSMKGLTASMGPVGLALTALTTIVTLFDDEIAGATASIIEWIDGTAALREEAERAGAVVEEKLGRKLDDAFGLSAIDALARVRDGVKDATGPIRAHMDQLQDVWFSNQDAILKLRNSAIAGKITWVDYRNEILALIPDTDEFKAKQEELKLAADAASAAAEAEAEKLRLLREEQEELIKAFNEARRPGDELVNTFKKLGAAGVSASDFAATYTEEIIEAAKAHEKYGEEIPQVLQELLNLAQGHDQAREALEEEAALVERVTDLWDQAQQMAEKLARQGLDIQTEALIRHRAELALARGEAETYDKALEIAINFVTQFSATLQKNRTDLQNQGVEVRTVKTSFDELNEALSNLGVTAPRSLSKMGEELAKVEGNADASFRQISQAQLRFIQETVRQTGEIPRTYEAAFNELLFTTDHVLKGEAREIWDDYVEHVKASGGEIPEKWKEAMARLDRENKAGARNMERVWEEVTANIITDFSRAVTDLIFEGQSLVDSMIGIAEQLGRSFTQTLIADLFSPVQELFSGLSKTAGGFLSGLTKKAGGFFGGLFGGGGGGSGEGLLGAAGGLSGLFTAGIGTAVSLAIAPLISVIARLFKKDPVESGVKEILRDFGVSVSQGQVSGFLQAEGIQEKDFEKFRKGTLSSPKALQDLLIPAAEATGQVDQLIQKFAQFETAWGTFDLSKPLREAIESGDFTAYNEAWRDVFAEATEFNNLIGDKLLSDQVNAFGLTADKLMELADQIRGLEEAGRVPSEILRELWQQIADGAAFAEEYGHELDPLIQKHVRLAETLRDVTPAQRDVLLQFLEMQDAPAVAARSMKELADTIQLLQREGASQEQIWELLAQDLSRVDEVVEKFGTDIPDVVQGLLDWKEANKELEPTLPPQEEGVRKIVEQFRAFRERGAEMVEDIRALAQELLTLEENGQRVFTNFEAQQRLWDFMGSDILRLADRYHRAGEALDPVITNTLRWALANAELTEANEALIRSILGIQDAIQDPNGDGGVGAADLDIWDRFLNSAKDLESQLIQLGRRLTTDGFPVLQAQTIAWDMLGDSIIRVAEKTQLYTGYIPPAMKAALEWALVNANLTAQNRELIHSILGIADATQVAASAMDSLSGRKLRGPSLSSASGPGAGRFGPSAADFVTINFSPQATRELNKILNPPEPLKTGEPLSPEEAELRNLQVTWTDALGRSLSIERLRASEAKDIAAAVNGSISEMKDVFELASGTLASVIGQVPAQIRVAGTKLGTGLRPAVDTLFDLAGLIDDTRLRADNFSGSLTAISDETGSVEKVTHDLMTAFIDNLNTWDNTEKKAADLEARLVTLGKEVLERGLPVFESQQRVFDSLGGEIVDVANAYILLGRDMPPAIKAALEFGIEQDKVKVALDGTVQLVDTTIERYADLAVQAAATGKVSGELASIIWEYADAQTAANLAANLARLEELKGLRDEFVDLRKAVADYLPTQKDLIADFLETGVVSDELKDKILAAGGSLKAFEDFGALLQARDQLGIFKDEMEKNNRISNESLDIIRKFADPDIVGAFDEVIRTSGIAGAGFVQMGRLSDEAKQTIIDAFQSASDGIRTSLGTAAQFLDTEIGTILLGLDTEMALVTAAIVTAFQSVGRSIIDAIKGLPDGWTAAKTFIDNNPITGTVDFGSGGFTGAQADWDTFRNYVEENDPQGIVVLNDFLGLGTGGWEALRNHISSRIADGTIDLNDFMSEGQLDWNALRNYLVTNKLEGEVVAKEGGKTGFANIFQNAEFLWTALQNVLNNGLTVNVFFTDFYGQGVGIYNQLRNYIQNNPITVTVNVQVNDPTGALSGSFSSASSGSLAIEPVRGENAIVVRDSSAAKPTEIKIEFNQSVEVSGSSSQAEIEELKAALQEATEGATDKMIEELIAALRTDRGNITKHFSQSLISGGLLTQLPRSRS